MDLEGKEKRRSEVKMSKSLKDICDLHVCAAPTAVVSEEPSEVSVSPLSFLCTSINTPLIYTYTYHTGHM